MASAMNDIDELQASLLRSLRAPTGSASSTCLVSDRAKSTRSHASRDESGGRLQHLGAMRAAGLVEAIRDGRNVSYQLSDPQILAACGLMRAVLVRRLSGWATWPPRFMSPPCRYLCQSGRSSVSDNLSIVLFSGTDDKLHAAATITAGAAAMGTPVSILLMYWARTCSGPIASPTTTDWRTTPHDPGGTSLSSTSVRSHGSRPSGRRRISAR